MGDRNPGLFPNLPNQNMTNVGPDRQEPFGNRSFADIVTQLDEAPTGRIMLGLGASSQAGLNGNIILHESNFDLFAIPRSWAELTSGRAFRGAGQEFRIELSPGTQINRYVVSFRDPYLFDLPIGLGVSGYQWSRFLSRLERAAERGSVLTGLPVRPAGLFRRRLPDRGCRPQRVQVPGAGRRPERGGAHDAGDDPPEHPVRQPKQPDLAERRIVPGSRVRARVGHLHLPQDHGGRPASTSPWEVAPTTRASGPSPSAASLAPPVATRRFTSGSSRATSGACGGSIIAVSARTTWGSTPAAC